MSRGSLSSCRRCTKTSGHSQVLQEGRPVARDRALSGCPRGLCAAAPVQPGLAACAPQRLAHPARTRPPAPSSAGGGQGRADACRVVVNLHERRWWHATVGTYVDGAEGSVELKLGTTGVAGLAERAELDVRVGSQTSTEAALSLGRSRLGGRPLDGNAVVQQASRNCEAASSYVERLRGVTLGVGRCRPAPLPGRRRARAGRQPPARACGVTPGGVDAPAHACAA